MASLAINPLTTEQSDYLKARDEHPEATSVELCGLLDISPSQYAKWNSPGPDTRQFLQEMRARDNAKHGGNTTEVTPKRQALPVMHVAKPKLVENPPRQEIQEAAQVQPSPEPAVATAISFTKIDKGPRKSLERVLGPYLTFEKYGAKFIDALKQHGGDFSVAQETSKTPTDVFNEWLHQPDMRSQVNAAAAEAGSKETLETFQKEINAAYYERRILEKRHEKSGKDGANGR